MALRKEQDRANARERESQRLRGRTAKRAGQGSAHTAFRSELRMMIFYKKGINTVFTLMLAGILILLLFFSSINFICKTEFLLSNIILSIFNLLLFVFMWIIWNAYGKVSRKLKDFPYYRIIKISAVCLFIWQLYLSYNIFFAAGWDAGTVYKAAETVAFGDVSRLNNNYFSTYPNNLFLVSVYAFVLKINRAVGIFPAEYQLMSIICLNCMCSVVSCVVIYKILVRFLNEKYAFVGFVLGVITFGFSPWITVCYSDTTGLLFPVLLLWFFVLPENGRRNMILRFSALVLVGVAGYSVKPQIIIIVIAAVLTEFIYILNEENIKKLALKAIMLLLGILMASALFHAFDKLYEREGFVLNGDAAYGMSHFFMMGLNEDRDGVFAEEDTLFSKRFRTKAERRKANLEVSLERLNNFGVVGYVKHLVKKLLVTYHDGTFAWGQEGNFFKKYYDEINTKAAPFLRNVYYPDGKYYYIWSTAAQAVWLMILLLCLLSGLLVNGSNSDNINIINILHLSVVGLTVFELLFECRARYLYTYIPIYCITAVFGISPLMSKTVKITETKKFLK